jgi:hypothetical protein
LHPRRRNIERAFSAFLPSSRVRVAPDSEKHEQIRERVWDPPEGWEGIPGRYALYVSPLSHTSAAYRLPTRLAMSSAQLRLAETIDAFYGASDRVSEGAMAANAYKRSVEELDAGIGRELVRVHSFTQSPPSHFLALPTTYDFLLPHSARFLIAP